MATKDEFTGLKDYSGLIKKNEYDHEKAELLAEAVTELKAIEKRKAFLEELIEDNRDLLLFLWTTLTGECKPLHKITDDHLKNILGHILNRGGRISPQIKAEALSRNIAIPDETAFQAQRLLEAREGEIIHDLDMDD